MWHRKALALTLRISSRQQGHFYSQMWIPIHLVIGNQFQLETVNLAYRLLFVFRVIGRKEKRKKKMLWYWFSISLGIITKTQKISYATCCCYIDVNFNFAFLTYDEWFTNWMVLLTAQNYWDERQFTPKGYSKLVKIYRKWRNFQMKCETVDCWQSFYFIFYFSLF